MARTAQANFIQPMLLLKADLLPHDPGWTYELKLDGYRAIAFKRDGKVQLRLATTRTSRPGIPRSPRPWRICRTIP